MPTVTDNLFSSGVIGAKQVGISFEPTTSLSVTNGQLTFGGVDTSKFNGTLHTLYVSQLYYSFLFYKNTCSPITSTSPSNEFVGVDQSITYGSAGTSILASTAGIADTGTTLILIATGTYHFVLRSSNRSDVCLTRCPGYISTTYGRCRR